MCVVMLLCAFIFKNLRVPKSKGSGQGSSPTVMHLDPNLRLEPELDTNPGLGLFPAPSASSHSPSPDAEYDKLLVRIM